MFSSFFRSHKKSPVESPENSETAAGGGSSGDFVVVPTPEPHRAAPPRPTQPPGGIYPSFGPAGAVVPNYFGGDSGPVSSPPSTDPTAAPVQRQQSDGGTFSYLQGVPFRLSADIRVEGCDGGGGGASADVMRIEVDQILAQMTRVMDLYGGGAD